MSNLLLADLAASGVKQIPSGYIRPITDRPNLSDVQISHDAIPLIDLHGLTGPSRSLVIKQISQACENDGFFQVKNHGISEELIGKIMKIARQFFKLPESERLKTYSDDPTKTTRLSTSFNVNSEKISSWRDFLRLHCYPLEDYMHEWPCNPPSFRRDVAEYCTGIRGLVLRVLEAISESLGLERDYIDRLLKGHYVSINYYPACQESELDVTHGVRTHTDPTIITILMQDDVPGLQVINDDKWIDVNPIPGAVVVHVGDMLQALSNCRYKSLLHQAIVNCERERVSIASYCYPSDDAAIGPAKKLIDDDHPAIYKDFTYKEFHESMWRVKCSTAKRLDLFMAESD
ncbi:hypothetical protein OIU77_015527 [Salix suchowensis]|uniref:Fe2OG dioxygenase domain-containing protein n=1 Tax=Salix suchowensis TaxID=1278906 RepID=A0ABQ8ZH86_9ROSI|nr:hypothetical protein OIU77_015527 [Salix suchowensis]